MKKNNTYGCLQRRQSITHYIDHFLEASSASVYLKDKHGSYLDINNVFIFIAGGHPDDVIGRNDLDLLWREQAPILMKNDQEVLYTEKSKTVLEPVQTPDGIKHFLNHKAPLRTQKGNIIGIGGIAFLIDHENALFSALNELRSLSEPKILDHIAETECKITVKPSANDQLTKRQLDCLYHLVKGMTMKQIARTLALSPKTVEHYLHAIKIKLNCKNRADLIEKALKLPYIKYKLRLE